MKKNFVPLLIFVLIVLQVLSLARIGDLQDELRNMQNQLASLQNNQSSELSNIYANIDAQLRRQSSIIASFDYSLGKVDREQLKIPITFTITPKEMKADTQATLYVSGESVAMNKKGTTFTGTLGADIFKPMEAKVVLTDSGIERTESLEIPEDLRGNLLPVVHARFERKGGQSIYKVNLNQTSGEYSAQGIIRLEVKPVQNNTIEKARLVMDVDGKVVMEELVNTGGQETEIDQKQLLAAGETLTLSVIATDSMGLNYKTIIDRLTLDEKGTPVHGEEGIWFGEVIVLDQEGKVLYSPYPDQLN